MAMLAVLEGAFCAGTAMGTASILSVGPNNMMLMREGLIRGRVKLVASTVWVSYSMLLVAALVLTDRIATLGSLVRHILSWIGLISITWFAFSSLWSYFQASANFQEKTTERETTSSCVRRVFAFVWLNPLTYVVTIVYSGLHRLQFYHASLPYNVHLWPDHDGDRRMFRLQFWRQTTCTAIYAKEGAPDVRSKFQCNSFMHGMYYGRCSRIEA